MSEKQARIKIDMKGKMPVVASLSLSGSELIEWYTSKHAGYIKCKLHPDKLQLFIFGLFNELANYQSQFFLKGSEYLRPFRQTDLALLCGVHESTISRVVRGAQLVYMGENLPAQFLFSGCVKYEKGPDVSVRSLKSEILSIIIDNPKASDALITQILRAEGFRIVRKTVGNYREQMKIPTTYKRLADPTYVSEAIEHLAPTNWLKTLLNLFSNYEAIPRFLHCNTMPVASPCQESLPAFSHGGRG
ncbi:MAG: hypothetical protein P8175_16850 [Deltaproteobacteria bacterium]|jgi:hypothetical protein